MRRVLSLRAEAETDIAGAHNWYLSRSPAKAQPLLEAIDEALSLIEAQPQLLLRSLEWNAAHQSQKLSVRVGLLGRNGF